MNAVVDIESVLLLGGTSDIGLATARALVSRGTRRVVLAGRDAAALKAAAEQLQAEGAETVQTVAFDAATAEPSPFVDAIFDQHGDIDLVLIAFGTIGDQARDEQDPAGALDVLRVNFDAAAGLGVALARRLRGQGHGHLVFLSSVAADRPRRGNFIYGASKAGADAFFQGLGDSLLGTGVHVMVVRPGRVRTKMTAHMTDSVPFTTDADRVAADILAGLRRGAHTVYSPPIMRAVMFGLRHLPRPLFRKVAERG